MQLFTQLIIRLFHANHEASKRELLSRYLLQTTDPARGYALAILLKRLSLPQLSATQLRHLIADKVPDRLFQLSHQYTRDLPETIALLWPEPKNTTKPMLSEIVMQLDSITKAELAEYTAFWLDHCEVDERWVLLKLLSGKLSEMIGTQLIKQTLAVLCHSSVHEIEQILSELQPPYVELFGWLEGKTPKPSTQHLPFYIPAMQALPISVEQLTELKLEDYQIEWLWEGIRVQLLAKDHYKALFNSSGDDLSSQFPELMAELEGNVVLDGRLLIKTGNHLHLQQRLKRHKPKPKLLLDYPVCIQVFDILILDEQDLSQLPLKLRSDKLEQWFASHQPKHMQLSQPIKSCGINELLELCQDSKLNVAGLCFKNLTSPYSQGQAHQAWFGLKREPYVVNAVLMYAQHGQGRHANLYADYTLGLWQDQQLLPIGKPYLELCEQEIGQIDAWVKNNTLNRFGPVRAVAPNLVIEVAFDTVHVSSRHVAGYSLSFPRATRVRWDKSAREADSLAVLQNYLPELKS